MLSPANAADPSSATDQTTRAAADAARAFQGDTTATSRSLFTAWAGSAEAFLRAGFDVQNAAIDAGLAVYDRAATSNRDLLRRWAEGARQTQSALLDQWQAGVKATERGAAETDRNGAAR